MHIIIGYIYIVKYSDARTVKITKPEEKSMKSFDKKEIEKLTQRRVVGKKEFDVYKTDIKSMFDDTIQTKSKDLPTAINVNGRTLVLFSALGKHFGKVEYNDEQRVASIWDGGEEDAVFLHGDANRLLGVAVAYLRLAAQLMHGCCAAYPVEVCNIRFAAEQTFITAEHDLVRVRADIADVQRRGRGDAEPLALADGVVYHALVPA